tara:strand:+ start:12681 stop:12923 length:243 start_codon:yes stop_codon:yes gene_type:complete
METKVVFRKDLNKVQGIPTSIQVQNEAGFGGFTHKDNCTKRNNITVRLVKFDNKSAIEKRTPCCNHLSGMTLNEYFELVN